VKGGKAAGKAGKGKAGGQKVARRGGGRTFFSMWSLLKAAVVLGALAAFLFLLPFGGRTLADRWRAAAGPADFAARTWAEMRGVPAPEKPPQRGQKPRVHARAGEPKPGDPAAAPEEGHTEQDRKALDKLLGEHLADAPKPK
jgi:hypothetical protein